MGEFARVIKGPSEQVRYEADASAATAAAKLAVPVQVSARKPGYAAAFAAAQSVLTQMQADARQLGLTADVQPTGVRFALDEKHGPTAQVAGLLVAGFPDGGPFWGRAELVAKVLDVVHRHCEPAKPDKDVAVYSGPAGVPT